MMSTFSTADVNSKERGMLMATPTFTSNSDDKIVCKKKNLS